MYLILDLKLRCKNNLNNLLNRNAFELRIHQSFLEPAADASNIERMKLVYFNNKFRFLHILSLQYNVQ